MIILNRQELEDLIDLSIADVAIQDAYRATSRGDVTLPPVGHITFPQLGADCHIKYGHLKGAANFVIKVATGFPQNSDIGLPTGNGLVLVLSAQTGQVEALLQDEMMLTDVRTAVGGAIATRLLARSDSQRVLVVGTGPQAQRQVEAHHALLPGTPQFQVWGRNADRTAGMVSALAGRFPIEQAFDLAAAVQQADIIVTATGATAPFIQSEWVQPGTHITAVGADAPGKQELAVDLVARADVIAVDLASQCMDHGEVCHALKAGRIAAGDLNELGTLLDGGATGRTDPEQITIADLTGIAAQDMAIADAVLTAWRNKAA